MDKIPLKIRNYFWNVFFNTRKQLFIVSNWDIAIANPSLESAHSDKFLLKNKTIKCAELNHEKEWCWGEGHECPIDLSLENNWDYSSTDHVHEDEDWNAWVYEVGVIQLPRSLFNGMQKKYREKVRGSLWDLWKQIFLHTSNRNT